MNPILTLDFAILDAIQAHLRCAFLDTLMPAISALGNAGIFWILLALTFLCIPKFRRAGLDMAVALIICLVVGNLTLKPLIARIRPYDINTAVELLIKAPTDYSFPSGHTMSSFAAATTLLYRHKKAGILAMILAALIAFSRLYLYVHYPTDVLCGLVFGVLAGVLAHLCVSYFANKKAVSK